MYFPTESHSSCFSGHSAGYDDEPGNVIPSASAALAIVFAVYIWLNVCQLNKWHVLGRYSPLRKHRDQDKHV
jgi:hypothetical protein